MSLAQEDQNNRSKKSVLHWALFFAALLGVFGASLGRTLPARAQNVETLTFVTAAGEHKFDVEIADTEMRRARGLMGRREMPANHGMLFDFKIDGPVSMWMKNTYLPLDMVFVSRDGVVVSIASDTKPMSEDIISSGGPVLVVIELNAGAARRIGLAPGDVVRHRIFQH